MAKNLVLAWRFALSARFFALSFIATVALLAAIGVGVISLVRTVYIDAVPFPSPDRLVSVFESRRDTDRGGVAAPDFLDWREQTQSFDKLAAVGGGVATVFGLEEARRLSLLRVSGDFFTILGAVPAAGICFGRDAEDASAEPVIVLSERTAAALFGEPSAAVGKILKLDDGVRRVIGVLPNSFRFPVGSNTTDGFVPLVLSSEDKVRFGPRNAYLSIVGMLRSGVTPRAAEDSVTALIRQTDKTNPGWAGADRRATIITLHQQSTEAIRPWMLLLLIGIGLTALGGFSNLANLVFTATVHRRRQFNLMRVLGAPRSAVLSRLVVENGLLSAMGLVVALPLAVLVIDVLRANTPANIPRADEIGFGPTGWVLLTGTWLIATAVATTAAGLAVRDNLSVAVRLSDAPESHRQRILQMPLLSLQTATATLLLGCTALLGLTVFKLALRGTEMNTDGVLVATLSRPAGAGNGAQANQFFQEVVRTLRDSGTFVNVAFIAGAKPMSRLSTQVPLQVDGREQPKTVVIEQRAITDGYLETFGIPLIQGTMFQQDAPEAVVSGAAAARHWPGQSPLGHTVSVRGTEFRIVGVAKDVRHKGAQSAYEPTIYVPLRYSPLTGGTLVVRPRTGYASGLSVVRRTVRDLDPRQTVTDATSLATLATRANALRYFVGALLCLFALITVTLSLVGVYGITGLSAAQRAREIAIRLAIGARPGQVARVIGRHVAVSVLIGLAIGIAGFFWTGRLLSSLLVDVAATDGRVIGASACGMLAAAALAAMQALRPVRNCAIADLFRAP